MGDRALARGLSFCALLLLAGGCAQSQDIDILLPPDGGQSATGGSRTSGGSGGATGTGGMTDGTGGNPGSGGAVAAGSGGTGTGGMVGTGGHSGTGGAHGPTTGTGGQTATAGTGGSVGTSAPTFTDIYNNILLVHCGGSGCHNPDTQNGVTYATQAAAYTSVKPYVTAGKGSTSTFYVIVSTGAMPPTGPMLSASDLSKIEAWINAGALNN